MIFIGIIIFLMLVLGLGYAVLLFLPKEKRQPVLPLSFVVGGGLISWQLFVIKFLFKSSFGNWCVWLMVGEILVMLIWYFRKNIWRSRQHTPASSHPSQEGNSPLERGGSDRRRGMFGVTGQRFTKLEIGIFALIVLVVILSLVRVGTEPLVTYDALANWALRVKLLYYYPLDIFNPNSLTYTSIAVTNYPWHMSLLGWLQAWLTGGVSATWINFLPWCYFSVLLMTVYAMAKDKLSRLWSLSLTLAVATMPLIFYHSYNFYADLPLATYLALICLVWRRWLIDKATVTFLLLSILAGLSFMVKLDAIFFVGFLFLITVYKILKEKIAIKKIWPLIIPIVLVCPWFVWLALNHFGLSNVAPGLHWHSQVWSNIVAGFFNNQSWHVWWYFVVAMLIASWSKVRRQSMFRYTGVWFIITLLAFFYLYSFTETYQYVMDNSALLRNYMLFIPLSVALVVDSLAAWFDN